MHQARPSEVAGVARPFLKWAGGKQQLLPALLAATPPHIERYFEPFLGGGALFFALMSRPPASRPAASVLADVNTELVSTYVVVRDRLPALRRRLAALAAEYLAADPAGRASFYYGVRADTPRSAVAIAARLIFLNKTCFNGLYRVNRGGRFNVPHGRYARPRILDRAALTAASEALRHAEVRCADFEAACLDARRADFVYLDPPFHPLSPTASFTAYTAGDFGRDDQRRLKRLIDDLTERGVAVLLSNSAHPWIEELYQRGPQEYRLTTVPARRAINARGDRRGAIPELLVTNYDGVGRVSAGARRRPARLAR